MSFVEEVKRGVVEGIKAVPAAIRSRTIMQPSPVSKYAMNPFASPNMSVEKWKKNINNRFRREAGNTVRKLFQNSNTKNTPQVPRVPRAPPRRLNTTLRIPRPSPYLYNTPIQYKTLPSNTKPQSPELRGGSRKTRKVRKYRTMK